MVNLEDVSLIDAHCHPFLPSKETPHLERYFTLSGLHAKPFDAANTLFFRSTVQELSRVLNVHGPYSAIIKARNRLYRDDPASYIRLLFEEVKVGELLVDVGYPSKLMSGYSVNLRTFGKLVPCRTRLIHRVDGTITSCLKTASSIKDAVQFLLEDIDYSVKTRKAVALKSTVAYLTGLEIKHVSDSAAREAFETLSALVKKGHSVFELLSRRKSETKTLWDYSLYLIAERAHKLRTPLQIHTGMGDAPFDLSKSNPALLAEFINSPECSRTEIVLVHCGYPYIREVGYLTNAYPNVYADLSMMIPFASLGVAENIERLLQLAPTSKIMYASDGSEIPEIFWMAALETKKGLAEVSDRLIRSGVIDDETATQIAKQILQQNATRVYGLT